MFCLNARTLWKLRVENPRVLEYQLQEVFNLYKGTGEKQFNLSMALCLCTQDFSRKSIKIENACIRKR